MAEASKSPTVDAAEFNAFFPSPYSLSQFTAPKSNLADADYPTPYKGGKWKILAICADERYLTTDTGKLFSTGNHPIETLVPMIHLDRAGFEFEIATVSGYPVKFEYWAMPSQDEAVKGFHEKLLPKFRNPKKLSDVVGKLGKDSEYIAVFIPGGHGALMSLPESLDVKAALKWAMANDRYVISLCHGPAALLAAGMGETKASYMFNGYKMYAFPDAMDRKTPDIGYMPGGLTWFFGEKLEALGVTLLNKESIDGSVHQDRKLLTGDSPLASNNLGKLAAKTLLEATAFMPKA